MPITATALKSSPNFKSKKADIKSGIINLDRFSAVKSEHKLAVIDLITYLVAVLDLQDEKPGLFTAKAQTDYPIDEKCLLAFLKQYNDSFKEDDVYSMLVACTHQGSLFKLKNSYPNSAIKLIHALNIEPDKKRLAEIKSRLQSKVLTQEINDIFTNISGNKNTIPDLAITTPELPIDFYKFPIPVKEHILSVAFRDTVNKKNYIPGSAATYMINSVDDIDKVIQELSGIKTPKKVILNCAKNLNFTVADAIKIMNCISSNANLHIDEITSIRIMKSNEDKDSPDEFNQAFNKLCKSLQNFTIQDEHIKNTSYNTIISFTKKPSLTLSRNEIYYVSPKIYTINFAADIGTVTNEFFDKKLKKNDQLIFAKDLNFTVADAIKIIEPITSNKSLNSIEPITINKPDEYSQDYDRLSKALMKLCLTRTDLKITIDDQQEKYITISFEASKNGLEEFKPPELLLIPMAYQYNRGENLLNANLADPKCKIRHLDLSSAKFNTEDYRALRRAILPNISLQVIEPITVLDFTSNDISRENKDGKNFRPDLQITASSEGGQNIISFKKIDDLDIEVEQQDWLIRYLPSPNCTAKTLQIKGIVPESKILPLLKSFSNNKSLTDIKHFSVETGNTFNEHQLKESINKLNTLPGKIQFTCSKKDKNSTEFTIRVITKRR